MKIDLDKVPEGTPKPQLVHEGDLSVESHGAVRRYPIEVWSLANGETVAVVSEVPLSLSLANNTEWIEGSVRARWPVDRLIHHWWMNHGLVGRWHYTYNTCRGGEHIGELPLGEEDFKELDQLGLVLKEPRRNGDDDA